MKLRTSIAALTLVCAACAPTTQDPTEDYIDGRATGPAKPAAGEGVQFVMPETIIPAGEERQTCWIPDWVPDRDYLVKSFIGSQNGMGHHVVALTSSIPREPGSTFDCTSLESMVSVKPLLVPDNATGENGDTELRLFPEDFAVRLPAGARIVLQSHYVNVAEQDLLVADVATFYFADESEVAAEASYFTVNHGGIDIPTGDHTTEVSCTVEERVQLVSLFGHMHDWGTAVRIERERAGARETLYEIEQWTVEYRDLAPVNHYAHDDPLVLEPGDTVRVTCSYHNDTDGPLRFPQEMCVAFGAYYPATPDGFIVCGD